MIKKILTTCFGLVLGLCVFGVGLVAIAILVTYPKLPSLDSLQHYQPKMPLTIYSADALGLFVSSFVNNVEKAMTVMPFVILLQFLFAGNIPLSGFLQSLSYFTLSRYSVDGLLDLATFKKGQVNLLVAWILLIAFSILLAYLASKLLKSVEKDTRG